jgi:hypothetical protein
MKIKFRQTGGFAGLAKFIEIDCDKIPADEATFLHSLLDQSGFFDLSEPVQRGIPDEEQYSVEVEAGGHLRKMHMDRSSVPDNLKPLIRYMVKCAKYEKRK